MSNHNKKIFTKSEYDKIQNGPKKHLKKRDEISDSDIEEEEKFDFKQEKRIGNKFWKEKNKENSFKTYSRRG